MSREEQIRNINEHIETLTERFETIHIEQGALLQDIKTSQSRLLRLLRAQSREKRGTSRANVNVEDESEEEIFQDAQQTPTLVTGEEERPYTNRYTPKAGDKVRITNPRPGQGSRGTITGFCRDGKAKINVGDHLPIVIRSSRNIVNIRRTVVSGNYQYERKNTRFVPRR